MGGDAHSARLKPTFNLHPSPSANSATLAFPVRTGQQTFDQDRRPNSDQGQSPQIADTTLKIMPDMRLLVVVPAAKEPVGQVIQPLDAIPVVLRRLRPAKVRV
jgi:hypothetical protein